MSEVRIKFKMEIPDSILRLKEIFKKNRYKLFVVGGAVRDAYLGITPKDFDLATDAYPDTVEEMMEESRIPTVGTGKSFGVINVFVGDDQFEVATFREDGGYSDSRRPDEVIFSTIENDVERRDLTINALFYDIDTEEIVDLVGGLEDLKNGVIRTVGHPIERFTEDRLRIPRAMRFAARFGSYLHPEIVKALKEDASLWNISPERIRDEFLKGIKTAKSVIHYLQLLDEFGLFSWIFKGLHVEKKFVEIKDTNILIAVLLSGNQDKLLDTWKKSLSKKLVEELKYTGDEKDQIIFFLRFMNLSSKLAVFLKKDQKISKVTDEQIRLFSDIQNIDKAEVERFISFKLTLTGEDIMREFNLQPGKEVGEKLYELETANYLNIPN